MSSVLHDWIVKHKVGNGRRNTEEISKNLIMKIIVCPSEEIWLYLVSDGYKLKVFFLKGHELVRLDFALFCLGAGGWEK